MSSRCLLIDSRSPLPRGHAKCTPASDPTRVGSTDMPCNCWIAASSPSRSSSHGLAIPVNTSHTSALRLQILPTAWEWQPSCYCCTLVSKVTSEKLSGASPPQCARLHPILTAVPQVYTYALASHSCRAIMAQHLLS